jgi:hypothetical protein
VGSIAIDNLLTEKASVTSKLACFVVLVLVWKTQTPKPVPTSAIKEVSGIIMEKNFFLIHMPFFLMLIYFNYWFLSLPR